MAWLKPIIKDDDKFNILNSGISLYNFDISQLLPLDDFFVIRFFPVIEGTRYAPKECSFEPSCFLYFAEVAVQTYEYERKIIDLIDTNLTKDMFKEHSLYLLKEHCKLFAPYNEKTKQLLKKLEALK